VTWQFGARVALCNLLRAQIGGHIALRRGASFVRKVFLVMVLAPVQILALDQLALWR
jgi:uncharacterized membrane protein YfcA